MEKDYFECERPTAKLWIRWLNKKITLHRRLYYQTSIEIWMAGRDLLLDLRMREGIDAEVFLQIL